LLREAYVLAAAAERDPWDFAVEIDQLRAAGLTHSALRWLVCTGFLGLGTEEIAAASAVRQFRPSENLSLNDRSCFVLTSQGVELVETLSSRDQEPAVPETPLAGDQRVGRPDWDDGRRELRWGGALIKRFRLPAANQTSILSAFQEEGWPAHIDDPLPQVAGLDPQARLHDAIKGLNRHQVRRLLRFAADGTGEGIIWEPLMPTT
jgi:hypothetical protein